MTTTIQPRVAIAILLAISLVGTAVVAQCAPSWQPGAPTTGPSDSVLAVARAPNGDLYAGGFFDVADGTFVHHVARWDGSAWHALGSGTDARVNAIALRPNGNCIAGGAFTIAGGVPAAGIAEWNGVQWNPLGTGIGGAVYALLVLPNGDVIVGGSFASAGGSAAANVARWSNGSWSALGAGLPGWVDSLALMPNGDIVAGGSGGFVGTALQSWNGTAWIQLTPPMYQVTALAVAPNGDLFVGGEGSSSLLSWNGTTFTPVPMPVGFSVLALAIDPSTGLLRIGGGSVWPAPIAVTNVLSWDGFTMLDISTYDTATVMALAPLANGELAAGCSRGLRFEPKALRRLSGSTWLTVGVPGPAASDVRAFAALGNGDMVVGGLFGALEGTPLANIGRWDGSQWQPLGAGVDGSVDAIAIAANGDLIVGGEFTHASGAPAQYVARWNGAAWSTLGAGLPTPVTALTTRANGDVLAACASQLLRWNGSAWTPLAAGQFYALATLPNDDVVAAGIGAVLWNGATVAPLGTLPGLAVCLLARPNGDLIAGGENFAAGGGNRCIVRWNGTAWTPLGATVAGSVLGLTELPNGDLLAATQATSSTAPPATRLMRWDGSTWSVLDSGDGALLHVAANERGEIFVAGWFSHVGSGIAANFARSIPSCPASASNYGAGCTGSAGPVTLAASSLPWAGGTFRSIAHGMSTFSLAVHVAGLAAISQPLPLGAPGCGLFVAPILTDLQGTAGGQVEAALTIPNLPSLVGAQLRTQVVGLELDSSLALLRTTSTNALLLTIGAL